MSTVKETRLPGVGVRYEFVTTAGARVGVLVHRTGRRDLLVYSPRDPSACDVSLQLDGDDARTVAELLGASRVSEQLVAMHQEIEGLSIDWLQVHPDSPWAGKSLQEAAVHTTTGTSIVAIIGPEGATPAPGATAVLAPGSTVVAVGSTEGVAALSAMLTET